LEIKVQMEEEERKEIPEQQEQQEQLAQQVKLDCRVKTVIDIQRVPQLQ
jgi:hypothetical protein